MRRFAVLAAIGWLCLSTMASAAPFDQISNRVRQYDDDYPPTMRPAGRASRVAYREPVDRYHAPLRTRRDAPADYRDDYRDDYRGGSRDGYRNDDRPAPRNSGRASQTSYREDDGYAPQEQNYRRGAPTSYHDEGPYEGGGGPEFYDDGYGDGQQWDMPCGGNCWNGWCDGPPLGFWGRAEYLFWWVRGSHTPALVTTSPPGTAQPAAGVLPDATVLFGNQDINEQGRSGGRFTLGYWFDECQNCGIESTSLFLGGANDSYQATSAGTPILARPFFNTQTQLQDAVLVAFPGIVTGSINATSSQQVAGTELNFRKALYRDCCGRFDFLVGYRFFHLQEGLNVSTNTTSIDTQSPIQVGTQFAIFDGFSTRNNFNGGQIGFNSQYWRGRWTLDVAAKVALGGVSQRVTINGSTTVTAPGGSPTVNEGGILALGSNSGTFNRGQFSVLPAVDVNLRYQLTPLWKLNLGYSFMAITNVVRPGDQIDLRLDPNQFPPPVASGTSPAFAFNNSDVWLQGINFGIECDF